MVVTNMSDLIVMEREFGLFSIPGKVDSYLTTSVGLGDFAHGWVSSEHLSGRLSVLDL